MITINGFSFYPEVKRIKLPGPGYITPKSARTYLDRVTRMLWSNTPKFTPEAAHALGQIQDALVRAGFLTWDDVEEIEISCLKQSSRT